MRFQRVAYSGAQLQADQTSTVDAVGAEAMAIIAVCDLLLSATVHEDMTIHLHYDAKAVGDGAMGQAAVPLQKLTHDSPQFAARILVSMAQRKLKDIQAFHTHAHEGNPFNEMADSVAGFIRMGHVCPIQPVIRVSELLQHPLKEWAWLEVAPTADLPSLLQVLANNPSKEDAGWPDRKFEFELPKQECPANEPIFQQIKIGTVNVGTCNYHAGDVLRAVSGKVPELLKQFECSAYDIVALQETRARYSQCREDGGFARLISAADSGLGGVEIWFNISSLSSSLGTSFEHDKNLTVWHQDARILAVHVHTDTVVFDILNIYAPQSGRTKEEITSFWNKVQGVIDERTWTAPVWLMGDFNAKVGSVSSEVIGTFMPDAEDHAGQCVRELCEKNALLIPSTFKELHEGESWTYIGPRGARSRVDYFAIAEDCQEGIIGTSIDSEIDVMNGGHDHFLLSMTMQVKFQDKEQPGIARTSAYDRQAARNNLASKECDPITSQPALPWDMHVNEHWSWLRDGLQDYAQRWFPKPKRQRRQLYFSENTWNTLCLRKDIRMQHRAQQRDIRWLQLKQAFQAWKTGDTDGADLTDLAIHQLQMQEAVTYEQQCDCDRQFRRQKKQNWKEWIEAQSERLVNQLHSAKCSDIFHIFKPKALIAKHQGHSRRPLPGLKSKAGEWCTSKQAIAIAWQRQFAEIEHAREIDAQELNASCKANTQPLSASSLLNIPTRFDMELALRSLNTRKAAGFDDIGAELLVTSPSQAVDKIYPLFLKLATRQQWVGELSGGWILPLWKRKGSPVEMAGYRAILLEPTISRLFAKAWRAKMQHGIDEASVPNQWGARPGLDCEALHLQIRMWQSSAKAARKSVAIAFVDLQQAFYTTAKPLIAKCESWEQSVQVLCQVMSIPVSAVEKFRENLANYEMVRQVTGSEQAAGMAATALEKTWFLVPNSTTLQAPQTGSRPGDPLADMFFTMVMSAVMTEINQRIDDEVDLPLLTHDHTAATNVTWIDDVALVVFEEATKVHKKTAQVMSIILEVAIEFGFQLSFGPGKTAILLSHHGKGATEARRECDVAFKDGMPVLTEHFGRKLIPIVPCYKHLGGFVVRNGALLPEVRVRGAQATSRIAPLRKITKDPRIHIDHKRTLIRSMSWSVLTFQIGTWFDMTESEYLAWQGAWNRVCSALMVEMNRVRYNTFTWRKRPET